MRLLPATLLVVLPLVGCASGQRDATSHEHPTPWVANAQAGPVAVRNVVVTPVSADAATPGATGVPQAYLSLALVSSQPDTLTGASVPGGTVTPTDPAANFAVTPNQILSIADPVSSSAGGPSLEISGLPTPPVVGTTIQVTLTFEKAGQVTLTAPVRDLATA
jgi:copper(I)-binding protein